MSLWDYTKKALKGIVRPDLNTEEMSTGSALKFYYRASSIPFVISALLAVVIAYVVPTVPTSLASLIPFANTAVLREEAMTLAFLGIALEIFIELPIGALIFTAIVQFFSKNIFKFWQGGYNKTFTAFVFSGFVSVFFMWFVFFERLVLVPVVMAMLTLGFPLPNWILVLIFVAIVLPIWALIVLTITLAKQQNVSIGKAFLGWFVPLLVTIVMIVILALVTRTLALFIRQII